MKTCSFDTKEEAAEAWNSWAGMVREITQEEFNQLNNAIPRDYPIKDGKLVMPDADNAFGDLVIADPGGYEYPWPRIYLSYFANSETEDHHDDMFMIYKLRSRWRLIERDHPVLKMKLKTLIENNDRENNLLNKKLSEWNKMLADSGFSEFSQNDLRGADLSGLNISPSSYETVNLRCVDFKLCRMPFSFNSEWILVQCRLQRSQCSSITTYSMYMSWS